MNVTISIIVPVYNSEKYLKCCLDSILKQTFSDFEVLLIDDGSQDNSGKICDEYVQKDKRFHVLHQMNQGQAAARNRGIELAKGEWIHFVDSDDCIHPQMLELLFHAVKKNNADISMCWDVEGKEIPETFFKSLEMNDNYRFASVSENYLKELLENGDKQYWIVWGKLIRCQIVRSQFFEEGRIYEDNAVVYKWLYKSKTIATVDENLYFYRINEVSTTKNKFTEKQLDRLWALEEQIYFYKNIKYELMHQAIVCRYIVACASCYKSTSERKIKRKIKHLMHSRFLKDFNVIKLNSKEKIHVLESFHPVIMKYYWIVYELMKRLKLMKR